MDCDREPALCSAGQHCMATPKYKVVRAENPEKWILERDGEDILIFDSKEDAEASMKKLESVVEGKSEGGVVTKAKAKPTAKTKAKAKSKPKSK